MISGSVSDLILGSFQDAFRSDSKLETLISYLVFTVNGGSGPPEAALHGGSENGSIFGIVLKDFQDDFRVLDGP